MCKDHAKNWMLLAVAVLLTVGGLAAQDRNGTGQDQQKPKAQKASPPQSAKKLPIAGATRVSTRAALEDAAKHEAKKPAADGAGPTTAKAQEVSADQAVVEFHPAKQESATPTSVKVESKNSKKAKDLHGTVYGATDAKNSGTRRVGGAVGASSKSGKTSVYVETEGSRTTPPR